jgi:hypothetical protein
MVPEPVQDREQVPALPVVLPPVPMRERGATAPTLILCGDIKGNGQLLMQALFAAVQTGRCFWGNVIVLV